MLADRNALIVLVLDTGALAHQQAPRMDLGLEQSSIPPGSPALQREDYESGESGPLTDEFNAGLSERSPARKDGLEVEAVGDFLSGGRFRG